MNFWIKQKNTEKDQKKFIGNVLNKEWVNIMMKKH